MQAGCSEKVRIGDVVDLVVGDCDASFIFKGRDSEVGSISINANFKITTVVNEWGGVNELHGGDVRGPEQKAYRGFVL